MKDKIKSYQISFYTVISVLTLTLIGTTVYSFFASYSLFPLDLIITILIVLSIIGLIVLLSLAKRSNQSELIKSIANRKNQILFSSISIVIGIIAFAIPNILLNNAGENLLAFVIPALCYIAAMLTFAAVILITNNINLDDPEYKKTNLILSISFIITLIFILASNIELNYFGYSFTIHLPFYLIDLCMVLYLSIKLLKTQVINQPSRKSNLISLVLSTVGMLLIVSTLLVAIKDRGIQNSDIPVGYSLNPFYYIFIMIVLGSLLIYASNLFAIDSKFGTIRRYIILSSIIAISIIASIESIILINNYYFIEVSCITSQGINGLLLGLYIIYRPEKLTKSELATSIVATVTNLSITICTLIVQPDILSLVALLVIIPIVFTIISVYNIVSIIRNGKKHQDIEANPQSVLQ